MEKYYRQYDTCRQNEKPFCSSACPFHVDVLDFQSRMAGNNYNAAYKTFRNAVGFPDIVAAMCPEYCAGVCPRGDLDQAVQLNLLEKTCVAKATKKDPTDYNVPLKDRKIAVIGAGISGLACTLRLTQKKYKVTIFEKTDRLGGKLWELLPPELFLEDIKRQLQFENYTLRLDTEVISINEISNEGFEAIYIATGKDGFDFHVIHGETRCRMEEAIAVFAGGSLTGKDPMGALAEGLNIAGAIEIFLKTGKLEYPEAAAPCRSVADPDKLLKTDAVVPSDHGLFTDEEAAAEAARCIRCQCDACMKYCDVCAYHKKWPMRIRDDIMATVSFSTSPSIIKKTPAKRLMNTCTQCGLCDEVCPENIEIGGMLLEARRSLHKQGTLPGAYHQFWLRDMEFTNSGLAALAKKAPEQEQCTYAFFPGCQLGAADPEYVSAPYDWLLSQREDMGLLIRCCGVPAEWAGDEELHSSEIAALHKDWEQLGKPVLILACPACRKHMKEYLPEIETISLYEILDQWGYGSTEKGKRLIRSSAAGCDAAESRIYSVFDPCTARNIAPMEQAVRNLARRAGAVLEELPKGDKHGCCGYGGNVAEANADFAAFVTVSRCKLSENPYIAYCVNCRDIFKGEGKQVLHILDLLFGIHDTDSKLPGLTNRRRNRVKLKEKLLKEFWGEEMESKPKQCRYKLKFETEILEKMDRNRILEEDVCEVIEFCEATKRRTYDTEKSAYTGYRESGNLTYWVEYRLQGEEYEILNAYTHRMRIKLEGVWNGRKTDVDL